MTAQWQFFLETGGQKVSGQLKINRHDAKDAKIV